MSYRYLFLLLFIGVSLHAKVLNSPIEAMRATFATSSEIEKKNILLTSKEFGLVQAKAKTKIKSKIFKIYIAKESEKILAYGILINRQVRSKNAVVLYMISNDSQLKAIEVIAFNEPLEYLPSQKYKEQFENIATEKNLQLGDDIATITGATLSARTIIEGARLAFALYNEVLREKE